jgi:hypothetical protein
MNTESEKPSAVPGRLRWIATGFIAAFAASVLTVIYTGLMVEGSRSEFDVGFRSVSLAPGETRSIELIFHASQPVERARLTVELPPVLSFTGSGPAGVPEQTVRLEPGTNVFAVDVRGGSPGSGYLQARLAADEPIAVERVFVTVTGD